MTVMPAWTWSLLALALALSMDAMAVAAARGLGAREHALRDGAVLALAFGVFQGVMPAIGWAAGSLLGSWAEAWDHWIAFALLVLIGAKMLVEAVKDAGATEPLKPLGLRMVLGLSIATSVDALAAGLTLPALGAPLLTSLVAIGVTTTLLTALGFALGRRLGKMAGRRLDALGGVLLIALGTKVLFEHFGWIG